MRYASIRSMDVTNGENLGVSLFVQGCPFKCFNCFNPETWDFNGGKEWTEETKKEFLELIDRPYIKRISLLGGECLAEENLDGILDLVTTIREKYPISQNVNLANPYKIGVSEDENSNEIRLSLPKKTIWIYSGFTWEEIMYPHLESPFDLQKSQTLEKRKNILLKCDVFTDGRYIDSQRDITLPWRGSLNQRVISVQESLKQGDVILHCN